MKTIDEIINGGYTAECIDRRDVSRLLDFISVEHWEKFGVSLKEGVDPANVKPVEWTEEKVIERLKGDVDFGFEKALNQRGLSAGMMYSVVKMWLWVLDDDLQHHDGYAQYGLPLFIAVADKYGFENPVTGKKGDEAEFACY